MNNREELKSHILKLIRFVEEKGHALKPYPTVVFSSEDHSNDILGPTGHYDNQTMTIVLYDLGRAKKDVLRTFSHELEHHEQNLEGKLSPDKLGSDSTSFTKGSDYLKKIEEEAYVLGNVWLREYTESLKNESA